MKDKFTKDDLKTGMVVELKNGEILVVVKGHKNGDFLEEKDSLILLSYFDDNLRNCYCSDMNIEKVYDSEEYLIDSNWEIFHRPETKLLWKRGKEKVEIHISQVIDIVAERMNCKPEDLKIVE